MRSTSPNIPASDVDAVAGDLGIFRIKLDQDCVTLEAVSDEAGRASAEERI
jgi:hypothetical protein